MNTNIVEKARIFASTAHAGQLRKYTNEPYIVHPTEVVEIVSTIDHTPEMLAAAWLHDVVEDTDISLQTIRQEFGDTISDLVGWLTDVSVPEDGNRSIRKKIDRDHLAKAPPDAQTIKVADLISNTKNIAQHDKNFAKVYIEEKRLLLKVLTNADKILVNAAYSYINKYSFPFFPTNIG